MFGSNFLHENIFYSEIESYVQNANLKWYGGTQGAHGPHARNRLEERSGACGHVGGRLAAKLLGLAGFGVPVWVVNGYGQRMVVIWRLQCCS